jgi:hypothetical protein
MTKTQLASLVGTKETKLVAFVEGAYETEMVTILTHSHKSIYDEELNQEVKK